MRKEEFRTWLSSRIQKKPCSDCLSRCKSVEESYDTDLDTEFNSDKCTSLLKQMQYTIKDERENKQCSIKFRFKSGVNIRYRMCNLRSAVRRYIDFCEEIPTQQKHSTSK